MAISSLSRRSSGELDTAHEQPDDILNAEDVAAELVGDADEPPTTAMTRPSANASASQAHGTSQTRGTSQARDHDQPRGHRQRPPAARMPPSAAALSARLEAAEAEVTRLRRHMRARDAYLVELRQALHASTSNLEASGIGSIEDAHRLFGRLRGQAFRIAELESELRHMEQRLSRLGRLVPHGSDC